MKRGEIKRVREKWDRAAAKEHEMSRDCWCRPRVAEVYPGHFKVDHNWVGVK